MGGFHRNRIGKECKEVKERLHGYLPIAIINHDREDKSDLFADEEFSEAWEG